MPPCKSPSFLSHCNFIYNVHYRQGLQLPPLLCPAARPPLPEEPGPASETEDLPALHSLPRRVVSALLAQSFIVTVTPKKAAGQVMLYSDVTTNPAHTPTSTMTLFCRFKPLWLRNVPPWAHLSVHLWSYQMAQHHVTIPNLTQSISKGGDVTATLTLADGRQSCHTNRN